MDSSDSPQDAELAKDVVESLGEPEESLDNVPESKENLGNDIKGDPLYVQKRLKQQKRSHDREMREMQARMAELQAQISPQNQQTFNANPYDQSGINNPGGVDETIHKAVSFALQQRDMEEQKARAAESAQQIAREYQELQSHLDKLSDKYEDFDDIVRSDSAPFTAHMRDAALMLPKRGPGSAGEVLYKLGKNPEELARISRLQPWKQGAELVALSHALISGGEHKGSARSQPLGQIKSNPITNSVGVTEKTTPAEIRALMKSGKFK